MCGEHPSKIDKKKESSSKEKKINVWHMMFSVLGLSIVSLGEKYGNKMLIRMANHLYQYGELSVRRAVPLCIALSFVSNPEILVTDFL
jgi:hypothetical protein